MNPNLYRVIIPVADIERAAHFYASLLGLEGERVSPGRHYFNLGGTILAIYDPDADGDELGEWSFHENQYIYIGVDMLDEAFAKLPRLGGTLLSASIENMPWGERLFYAHDPSGVPICLVDSGTLFAGSVED